ncbi:P2X purinoceptor 4-like isoform X2 [Apostichopus japonicus]|uniref:P2X purinoceptor 4-like isoform X2 n=1 Tax=Stichopus japonicus TaxID=307972 RepID=UPI003AB5C30E
MCTKMAATRRIRKLGNLLSDSFFDYDTPKMVQIKSWKAGAVNRLVQLIIILYAFGYVIIFEKGYQTTDKVLGSATSKLKGIEKTNFTGAKNIQVDDISPYNKVWDVTDYVIPAQSNGFFVMTNMVLTNRQTRGECAEDPTIRPCINDSTCVPGTENPKTNGRLTGRCVPYKGSQSSCEVQAWCPTEVDLLPLKDEAVLGAAGNFTVMIRNAISFPKFNFTKTNILSNNFNCNFNSSDPNHKFCPIFKLSTIAREAGRDFQQMALKGGVIIINIDWKCNLDWNEKHCVPKYSFIAPNKEDKFNFRFSSYYRENGTESRDLTKAYGILFQIEIFGEAGKFDIVPLMLNIASGVALLSLATVMCDVVVLYFLKKRRYYKECKYQNVSVDNSEVYDVSDVTGAMKMNDTSLISGQYLKPNAIVTLKQTGNGKTQSRSSLVSGP